MSKKKQAPAASLVAAADVIQTVLFAARTKSASGLFDLLERYNFSLDQWRADVESGKRTRTEMGVIQAFDLSIKTGQRDGIFWLLRECGAAQTARTHKELASVFGVTTNTVKQSWAQNNSLQECCLDLWQPGKYPIAETAEWYLTFNTSLCSEAAAADL